MEIYSSLPYGIRSTRQYRNRAVMLAVQKMRDSILGVSMLLTRFAIAYRICRVFFGGDSDTYRSLRQPAEP